MNDPDSCSFGQTDTDKRTKEYVPWFTTARSVFSVICPFLKKKVNGIIFFVMTGSNCLLVQPRLVLFNFLSSVHVFQITGTTLTVGSFENLTERAVAK